MSSEIKTMLTGQSIYTKTKIDLRNAQYSSMMSMMCKHIDLFSHNYVKVVLKNGNADISMPVILILFINYIYIDS